MEVNLAGRVALVTGPPDGIGAAIAAALAANGAIVSRSTGFESPNATSPGLPAELGILVNIAFAATELAEAGRVDALGRAAAAAMASRGSGRIVNLVSALGLIPAREAGGTSATAAAILSLTRVLAMEMGPRGVLVNALAVGAVEGEGLDGLAARQKSHIPLGRAASLDEIAASVLFLVDPDNSYMTGHTLAVDGGWIAGYARNF